jgi:hypothetical protein
MMQELKHEILESSKQLPSIKLIKTMIYRCAFLIYHLPHVAFSVTKKTINFVSTKALLAKTKEYYSTKANSSE